MKPRYTLLAVDAGPRETLLPAAQACGVALEDASAASCAFLSHWRHAIELRAPDLLVVGTSDSGRGRTVESAARRTACAAGVPIVAIEDFPGNYTSISGGEASLVLVESAQALELYARRLGAGAPPARVMSPARYDTCRARLAELRRATSRRWQEGGRPRALWAGQPETEDSVRTLEALLPALRAHEIDLAFKAHPRDPGYVGGIYQELLERAAIRYEDLTGASMADALGAAPRLVLTQFSSAAIEAGFYGIPSLCVLLPDAGGARLQAKKSYAVPLFCSAGAAALADDETKVAPELARALCDEAFRSGLIASFDRYFDVHTLQTPALLDCLGDIAALRK